MRKNKIIAITCSSQNDEVVIQFLSEYFDKNNEDSVVRIR